MRRFEILVPPSLLASAELVAKRRKWSTAAVMRMGTEMFVQLDEYQFQLGSAVLLLKGAKEQAERLGANDWSDVLEVALEKLAPVQEALRI